MKTKIYQSFKDKFSNEYNFTNYLDFAQWWFNLSYKTQTTGFEPSIYRKLQNCAVNSKEARTKVLTN